MRRAGGRQHWHRAGHLALTGQGGREALPSLGHVAIPSLGNHTGPGAKGPALPDTLCLLLPVHGRPAVSSFGQAPSGLPMQCGHREVCPMPSHRGCVTLPASSLPRVSEEVLPGHLSGQLLCPSLPLPWVQGLSPYQSGDDQGEGSV